MKWILFLSLSTAIGATVALSREAGLGLGWAFPMSKATAASRPDLEQEPRKIFASGIVEGAQREITLNFEIDGRLVSLDVREGDTVEQGQVLARLDPSIWHTKLQQAEHNLLLAQARKERILNAARDETRAIAWAEVRRAEVSVAEAHGELQRAELLLGKSAISEEEFENRRHAYRRAQADADLARARAAETDAPARTDDLKVADAEIAVARAEVRHARTMLEKTQLIAPAKGVVLHVETEPGQLVGPEQGRSVLTIANVDEMRARAYVEELDALAVHPGQRAYVTADGLPGRPFEGTVVTCHPYMAPKRIRNNTPAERIDVKVREVLIALDGADKLVIGLPVDVFILQEARRDREGMVLHAN